MVILMPPEGAFYRFEAGLDAAAVEAALAGLAERTVALALPRWKFSYGTSLKEPVEALGMKAAFVPDTADFSGMDGTRSLYISDVVHKAFVRVDEEGTEAAAATGVIAGTTSAPVDVLRVFVDRPFVFLIRERTTGAVVRGARARPHAGIAAWRPRSSEGKGCSVPAATRTCT